MSRILVTGATGFIGQALCKTLSKSGRLVRGTVRSHNSISEDTKAEYINVEDINIAKNWKDVLDDIDCIVHCAGRAHVMNETKTNVLNTYRLANVESTRKLAVKAAEAGVKKLIFLSSIKVNGEETTYKKKNTNSNNQKQDVFSINDTPNPKDPYAISKFEAEKVLWEVSAKTQLQVTVVRLPLVYGPNVKGNLARLIKMVKLGVPLPISTVKNQRSMIGLENLVDLLICCIDHPEASGKTFLASDGEDLSSPDLIKLIASSMEQKAYLFPIPLFLLKSLCLIFGKQKEISRLTGSLRVDNSYTKEILNWTPPYSVKEGIKRMVIANNK
ncbi:NAD-dependent epimerase/dehydratase family protein [Candidatus Pelagibacter sp.]|nr:NAD-dependent epimerase/dehydratase family protein [Candidatus Pelagibacter sp.]